jgi:cytochrome c-type biogenesis protein CcmH/NrfG
VDYQQQKVAQMILRILVLATLVSSAAAPVVAQPVAQGDVSHAMTSAQAEAAIRAAREAVAANPGDAELYARLSQTYASVGSAEAALHAIEAALALEPGRADYIRARATLATWTGDYRGARDSYLQLEALYPDDLEIALALARVSAWSGDTDRAVNQYRRYLQKNASNAAVWLELARAESWRGNYPGAIEGLEAYKALAGETKSYVTELAAVLSASGRPGKAEDLLTPYLAQSPLDYDLNLTHTLALGRQQRAKAAFDSLDTVRQLSPDDPQTRTAERVLRTLLGSSADAPFSSYTDSDALNVQRVAPRAVAALNSGTRLSAGYERSRLDARSGSGLDAIDGQTTATYQHLWAGAAQRVGAITVNGQIGYATANDRNSNTYGFGVDARVADSLRLSLSHASAPFVISPRTVDLGLTAVTQRAQVDWTPALRYQVLVDASFQDLSDGNSRWEVTLSPRRTMARRAGFNLDLGATAYRLETSRDLNHGYYDPRYYEYYAAGIYPYIKVRENVGLALTAGLGVQRDNTEPSFHFGGNVSGEATFGIYRPWVLKVNGSATLNGRLESGAFRAFGLGAALVRRF